MHALIAAQVCFCFLMLFVAGLFVSTFDRLSHQPIGFSAERILTLDTVAKTPQAPTVWDGIAGRLRSIPGVEKVAVAGWPLLSGQGWNNSVSINGGPPGDDLTYFLRVSPGWIGTMRIPLTQARDFRSGDVYPGAAIVNETFVKRSFRTEDPTRYRGMRDAIPPVAYVPFDSARPMRRSTFIVRTLSSNPTALAPALRREVTNARSDFRVSNVRTQQAIDKALTVRERLLAMLAAFFGVVALVPAWVDLYGVLAYSVLQRRREIGIRVAIGAQPHSIARLVMGDVSAMVLIGAAAGLALGMISVRSIESLLYGVRAPGFEAIAVPTLAIVAVSLLASLPALIRAVRIDAVAMLRAE